MTDNKSMLVGIIDFDQIRPIIFNSFRVKFTPITEMISQPKAIIDFEEGIEAIMEKFESSKADLLPVVNNQGKYMGFLPKLDVLESYREKLKEMVIE
ncbi:MAG: hypothetical protein EOO48_13895 [Flavobacterium sp.]|nr:MAG: hypothetical protein EOO48_13895 [Flavobacterium sp.]